METFNDDVAVAFGVVDVDADADIDVDVDVAELAVPLLPLLPLFPVLSSAAPILCGFQKTSLGSMVCLMANNLL